MAAIDQETVPRTPTSPPVYSGQETSYIYIRNLGSGSFAEANLYKKTEDNSLVVWKEISLNRLNEKEQRDSVNEIDVLSLINHANVITYYNHFMDGDTLLIEMEYANGGNLAQKIVNQKQCFDEQVVKWYTYQLVSALVHIHDIGIIHRDIKTLNIFMTKNDLLKLGDFGISKILESNQLAETVAGTPLYMSPELMKGKKYDYKTDIWSLGCVVYELLTLQRAFQGTNQLQLAYEIVNYKHGDIGERYSADMRSLVDRMLKKEAVERPTAEEIINCSLFNDRQELAKTVWEKNAATRRARVQSSLSVTETFVPVVKAKMTEVYQWGGGKLTPQKQDVFVRGTSAVQVAAGHAHLAAVTVEKELYTWANIQGGGKIVGQLGHGDEAAYKAPKLVEALEGKGIKQVGCGEDFTVCITDEGQMYAFGSDYYGCLGCDQQEDDEVLTPILVDFFSSRPVQEISCGDAHVVALTRDGEVYTWGNGEFGRLGLGSEDDFALPQRVQAPKKHIIKHVCGGPDGSFLVTTTGRVLACGSNEFNKLGFNSETSGLKKRKPKVYDIPCKYTFTLVRPLMRSNVKAVSAGRTHSAVIDYYGHLYTFGSNKYGQLGVGDFRSRAGVCRVLGHLSGHRVENVTCGDCFTVVSTDDNQVYSWGNGENGRLGAIFTDQGKGPNGVSVSMPRAIFGALHIVPDLNARHWNTILIAEKVLNRKILQTKSSLPKFKTPNQKVNSPNQQVNMSGGGQDGDVFDGRRVAFREDSHGRTDSAFVEEIGGTGDEVSASLMFDNTGDSGKPVSPGGSQPFPVSPEGVPNIPEVAEEDEFMPPWLEAELADEIVPMPGLNLQSPAVGPEGFNWNVPTENQLGVPSASPRVSTGSSDARTVEAQSIGSDMPEGRDVALAALQSRIEELELENSQLKNTVESQRQRIAELESMPGS